MDNPLHYWCAAGDIRQHGRRCHTAGSTFESGDCDVSSPEPPPPRSRDSYQIDEASVIKKPHPSPPSPQISRSPVTRNITVPIDVEEIYRTAADMMFVVSDYPLTQTWMERTFTSPIGPAAIYVKQSAIGKDQPLNTQRLIWGLNHMMFDITLSEKYCQTIATLKWDGVEIGTIEIVPRRRMIALQDDAGSEPASNQNGGPIPSLSHFFDKDITINCAYGKKPV